MGALQLGVPTFAHVGKTDARDVMRGPPDWTTVNGQSDAP